MLALSSMLPHVLHEVPRRPRVTGGQVLPLLKMNSIPLKGEPTFGRCHGMQLCSFSASSHATFQPTVHEGVAFVEVKVTFVGEEAATILW